MALDWNALGDEVVEHTRALIRFDTTNPPGDELRAAEYCAEVLRAAGLDPHVVESAPGRGSCTAGLSGDHTRGGPLLLHGHLDVVAADPAQWTHPPFAAEVHDGYIWGRGAVDMKNMVAMNLVVLATLARNGVQPRRDILFAAVADEEAGSNLGAKWLVDNHPDRVRAEYALGELGGFTQYVAGRTFYPVQVAEKGIAWLRARTRGREGHGSIPHDENAVVRLAQVLETLGSVRLPQHNTPVMSRFLRRMGAAMGFPASIVVPLLQNPTLSGTLLSRVLPDRDLAELFSALLSNTVSPTVLRAGSKTNQIPAEASAELDGRTLPGQSAQDLIAEIRAACGDPPWLELEVMESHDAIEAPADTPLFACIEQTLAKHDPAGVVLPNMIPGFTDAWCWARLGATCYGFAPIRFDPAADIKFSHLYHGIDERIPVDGLQWGLRVLYDTVRSFAAPEAPS